MHANVTQWRSVLGIEPVTDSTGDERIAKFEVVCHTREDLPVVMPEWKSLHRRVGAWSPFSDPDFQMTWCSTFIPTGHEVLLSVRRVADDQLVAMVPLYSTTRQHGAIRSLHLFGAYKEPFLHELPEILLDPSCSRPAMAAVLSWLGRRQDWDWLELSLRQDQIWVEPRWLSDAGLIPPIVLYKSAVPMVTLNLDAGTNLSLKRNLRESLRRSRNRIARDGGDWRVVSDEPADPEWNAAVADLVRLHHARSASAGRVKHGDVFRKTSQEHLLRRLGASSTESRPRIYRMLKEGDAVAVLLTFVSTQSTWLSVSGFLPEYWDINAVTTLQWEAVQHAARVGHLKVIFSTGVDTAKLRWSEHICMSHQFLIVNPRRRSLTVFYLYWFARSIAYARTEARRFSEGKATRGAGLRNEPSPKPWSHGQ